VADQNLLAAGTQIAELLDDAGFDVLLDDREERAGVKFKDADLVGIPYRVNVGKKAVEGKVELVTRSAHVSNARRGAPAGSAAPASESSSEDVAIAEIVTALRQKLDQA
jgi:prolyl-tRNA synthetase